MQYLGLFRRIFRANGMSRPNWHYPYLTLKILPVLTYRSVIWNVDITNNAIVDGIPETSKTAKLGNTISVEPFFQ